LKIEHEQQKNRRRKEQNNRRTEEMMKRGNIFRLENPSVWQSPMFSPKFYG
jgi:hypothetical protein